MKINTQPNAFRGRRAAAFRAFFAIGSPIRFRVSTLPIALIAIAGTSASVRAEDIEPASSSRLASISLPSGAAYELKLVVRRKSGELIWETGPNRTLFVSAQAEAHP